MLKSIGKILNQNINYLLYNHLFHNFFLLIYNKLNLITNSIDFISVSDNFIENILNEEN